MDSVNGQVDSIGRALIRLNVRKAQPAEQHRLTVWVDTAFTGELVVPRETIAQLGFEHSSAVTAELADGKEVLLDTYTCILDWFGGERVIEVIESDGGVPLLGIGLLNDQRLNIDYRASTLVID